MSISAFRNAAVNARCQRLMDLIRRQCEAIIGIETDVYASLLKRRSMELDVDSEDRVAAAIEHPIVGVGASESVVLDSQTTGGQLLFFSLEAFFRQSTQEELRDAKALSADLIRSRCKLARDRVQLTRRQCSRGAPDQSRGKAGCNRNRGRLLPEGNPPGRFDAEKAVAAGKMRGDFREDVKKPLQLRHERRRAPTLSLGDLRRR